MIPRGLPMARMLWILAVLPALATGLAPGAGAASTQATPDADARARPVPLRQQPQSPGQPERAEWARRLSDPDLDRRLLAYAEFAEQARRDPTALAALEAWAADQDRSELAWTARLLLREVSAGTPQAPVPVPWPFGTPPGPPGGRGQGAPEDFLDDSFGRFFEGARPGLGFRDLHMHFGDPFAELEGRLRELERSLGRGRGPGATPTPPSPPGTGGLPLGPGTSARSVEVEIQPDGTRVRIRETRDGEERVEEYRADSLAELLDQHPELGADLGGLSPRRPEAPRAPVQRARGLLGIQYTALAPERGRELQLEPGVGLEIHAVVPGSLAEELGLAPGEILVELEGRLLYGAEDVRAVLAGRAPDAGLEGRVIGADGVSRAVRIAPPSPLRRALEGAGTRNL